MTKRRNYLFLGIIFGALFLFLALVNTNLKEVFFILTTINLLPVFLGFIFLGTGLVLKTWRWRILLEKQVLFSKLFAILTVGYLANNLLPARAGELIRIYLVGRREKVGISKTLGSIVLEKTLDTFILVVILISFFFNQPFLQRDFRIFFAGITISDQWKNKFKLFFSSFKILKNKKNLLLLIGLSSLIWVIEAFWNYSLLYSLGLKLPLSAAFFLAAVVNLGLFIPSPPGYIGVFHFLATFALLPFGVDKSQALSYAILQHGLEYFILSGFGAWSAVKLSFNPFKEKKWQKN
jgi:uncharacterized membrane protein YbhN (UPF0104 family)